MNELFVWLRHGRLWVLRGLLLTLCLYATVALAQGYTLSQGKGDNQPHFSHLPLYTTANSDDSIPIYIQLTQGEHQFVGHKEIVLEVISSHQEEEKKPLLASSIFTNKAGMAIGYFHPKHANEGEYIINARLANEVSNNLIFQIQVRKKNWIFMLIIGLIGGLALFLFGMNMMSSGLQKSAGSKMRYILEKITQNKYISVGIGAFITMIVQSSSATMVMLIGFINSGLLTFVQSIGIIYGASIGTTITAQLIAFKVTEYSLLLIGIGAALDFFAKKEQLRFLGESILGFGLLFFGMFIMSEAMSPLKTHAPFIALLLELKNPLIGILVGIIFTGLIQSSSAFIGILIILSLQGLLHLEASIALVLGANIGTAVTGIIASIGGNNDAKRIAWALTFFKLFGVSIFVWWIPTFSQWVYTLTEHQEFGHISHNAIIATPRQIANAHTIFNVLITAIALPLNTYFAQFMMKLIPQKSKLQEKNTTSIYLNDDLLNTPSLALAVSRKEVIRMAENTKQMVQLSLSLFFEKETKTLTEIKQNIHQKELLVDALRDEINPYLVNIGRKNVKQQHIQEAFQLMYTIKELEQIADLIAYNMVREFNAWQPTGIDFSEQGKKELQEFHHTCLGELQAMANRIAHPKQHGFSKRRKTIHELQDPSLQTDLRHYQRLIQDETKSIMVGNTHVEITNILRSIMQHAQHITHLFTEGEKIVEHIK